MLHDLHLAGHGIVLRPLEPTDAAEHAALTRASPSVAEDLAWHTTPWPVEEGVARAAILAAQAHPSMRSFAVLGDDQRLRGVTSFYDLDPAVPRVEIGATQYGRRFWGGRTNPACKLLLLTHAFEVWGCARVALRCDSENARSAAAIRRLGARPEGVLRQHRRRHDGTLADTAYFSVLASEWPEVRSGLSARVRS